MARCTFVEKENGIIECSACGLRARTTRCVAICDPERQEKMRSALRARGVGTELKQLLAGLGISESAGCDCKAKATLMDSKGIEWCEANMDEIVGWMRDEAKKRGILFFSAAGKAVLKLAIRRAKANLK